MDPWTLYWQSDHLESCIASATDSGDEIADYWVHFARSLPPRARLIDVATGNGAVPAILVRAGLHLDITGVDKADVDPARYLADVEAVRGVRFIGGVDLSDASALPGSYDALTSQFGLEYLPEPARARLVAHLLGSGGRFQLLLHHQDSEIVRPRRRDLDELDELFAAEGLMPAVRQFAAHGANAKDLEYLGHRHLAQASIKTNHLSGQILAAVDRILGAHENGETDCRTRAAELHARVSAEAQRLQQLIDAALDQADVHRLTKTLQERGLTISRCGPLSVHDHTGTPALVGWDIAGEAP
jgi:ubiquinone/menaquinone biosynthesis C-methylase UbiE